MYILKIIGHMFRLGGGVFVDTYLSQWKKRRVAAKRLIVGSHCNTNSSNYSSDWIIEEVTYLRFSNIIYIDLLFVTRTAYKTQNNKRIEINKIE